MNLQEATEIRSRLVSHGFDSSIFKIDDRKCKIKVRKNGKEVIVDLEPLKSQTNPMVQVTSLKEEMIRSLRYNDFFEPNNEQRSLDKYLFGIKA